ncbi:unnamed protein product [Zymoseptoria tritici ST99CH_1A5]|uniref:Alpha 1,4-glycosyltransferase domain-containing protein n=1 Tax=Zymoseptoria tritici ST99CH_1A5 TaxID=1276529 RepID=A0A1Y6LXI7_ZYMTR|nr:unnamed protein product [Zymoseptoria tritici ST99CH_1A5]
MHYTAALSIARYTIALLISFLLVRFCIHARDRSRFQRHLHARYITWSDFPSQYTSLLKSKDWPALEADKFDYTHSFPSSSNSTIPRTIHFIWFKDLHSTRPDTTQIPSLGSDAPELCQKHNPTYNITIWDANAGRRLIEDHYAWFITTYDSYKYPIQRIDALKYFILHHHGGVYMDLDIACRRPLDPLLEFPAWFPEASPLGVNNDLMASRAGHPVVELMIRNLEPRSRWNFLFPYVTVFWTTGPQFTGDMLFKWWAGHSTVIAETGQDTSDAWFVLPRDFYSEEYTFFGHSPGGTWHGQDVATVLWACMYRRRSARHGEGRWKASEV